MKGLRSITPLGLESLRGIVPATDIGDPPVFEMVDPRTLFVEEGYQRDLGENSTRMVRKIVFGFSWAHFKPPVCVRIPEWDNLLVCIDGQHTAIGAASHPDIKVIPVMIVHAADAAARAGAFVGHNRDRLGLTQMAIYHAEVAAGDPLAVSIQKALDQVGGCVLPKPINLRTKQRLGATIAVGTLKTIAHRHGGDFLASVLKVLVDAGRGPIKADEIAAVSLIGLDKAASLSADLSKVIGSRSAEAWAADASLEVLAEGGYLNAALARLWTKEIGTSSPMRNGNTAISKSAASIMEARRAPPRTIEAKPIEPPRARPAPVAATVPLPRPVAAAEPPKAIQQVKGVDENPVIIRNGVTLDLMNRIVTHRGRSVVIPDDNCIRLVACLARGMPGLIDEKRALQNTLGSLPADGSLIMKRLITTLEPSLAKVRLEIRTLPKIGLRLHDQGV
jgi:hypothetical protein